MSDERVAGTMGFPPDLTTKVLKGEPLRHPNGVVVAGQAVPDALRGLDIIQQALDELGGVL